MTKWLVSLCVLMLAILPVGCLPSGSGSQGEVDYPPVQNERVALVIGNSQFRHFSPVPGAHADAELVAEALRRQGFNLIGGGPLMDLNWAEIVQYMRVFEAAMSEGGVAVFYHSGHAAQVGGENFIVPVDANAWDAGAVDLELVRIAGSFRPPAGREPRIKMIILDRTLPGPLLGSPTPLLEMTLADEPLDSNEIQVFASSVGSRIPRADIMLNEGGRSSQAEDDASSREPSILSQAFADAVRVPFYHVAAVAYQLTVMVANHTNDHQHVRVRYGETIRDGGPLVGTQRANRLLSRLDAAEQNVLVREREDVQAIRSSISRLVGGETRSIQAISDTVATLTVLNIDDTFPLSRSGRVFVEDDGVGVARLEAWRRVLEESRASRLDDWQKAAILSVTSSTSSSRLHAAGIDVMLENGDFGTLPDAIESLAATADAPTQTARISIERRRMVERALFELPQNGHGAGSIINRFPAITGVEEPEPGIRLDIALNQARAAAADCSPEPLNSNQMEAIASFAISVSLERFRTSSLCRRLGEGDPIRVARELAYSSFDLNQTEIFHSPELARRRAYEAALFLAVTEGAARDRLHELRLARTLEARGITVAVNATAAEMQAATRPTVESVALAPSDVSAAFNSADGLRSAAYFIRMFEGMELEAYQDIVGVWTIGFGTTGPHVQPGMRISTDQAMRYLLDYIDEDWRVLDESIDPVLAPQEQAAILSLSYNVGRGRVASSTLVANLNSGDYVGAADQFLVWNQARIEGELTVVRGLERRRRTERALFRLEAAPSIARSVLLETLPFRASPEAVGEFDAVIGFGHIAEQGSLPRRASQEEAIAWLESDLERVRAEITNALHRDVEPLQMEALTIIAFAMGPDRFLRTPIISYINEGNVQASLAAIGYWRDHQTGPDGRAVENWDEIRANAAALYTMGYRY
jgi:lysozyme